MPDLHPERLHHAWQIIWLERKYQNIALVFSEESWGGIYKSQPVFAGKKLREND